MKPVFQMTVDSEKGDCFSAALASILEVPLEAIPRFAELHGKYNMMDAARPWLAENYGLSIVTIQMERELTTGEDIRIIGAVPGTPCIAGGKSATFEGELHAVVGEIDEHGMNFRMTHDPNPAGKGIVGRPLHLYFLVPLDYNVSRKALEVLRREIEDFLDQTVSPSQVGK
jgi:hypothetical protein